MSILYFDYYAFDLASSGVSTISRYREPRERSIDELLNIQSLNPEMNNKEYGKFIVEGHKRLVSPLTSLGFALIGLSCLIASSFSRNTQTRQVILAIFIMIVLQGSILGVENLVAKQLELVPLLYILGIAPIILGFFFMLLWQSRRRRWNYSLPV